MFDRAKQFLMSVLPLKRKLPDVGFEGEEGFVDLSIPILKISDTKVGSVEIEVCGNTPIGQIGFIIEVLPEWKQQDVDEGRLILYWGTIRYRSAGANSNRFVSLLAQEYGQAENNRIMKDVIECTAVGIHSDPRLLKTSRVDLKIFLDRGPEDIYAEIFTNIDMDNKIIEFHEKDFEYRIPLIDGLSA